MNTNTTDSNKFDSSKSKNNTRIPQSLLTPTFGNRDVEADNSSATKALTHVEQPSEAKTIVARNLQDGSRHDYEDDGPQPLKPIGVATQPTDKAHVKWNDYDDDGPQPLKPMGATIKPTGNMHIKQRDDDGDGPQPLKALEVTTKPVGNTYIKERDYDNDESQAFKPIELTTKPTGDTSPINQSGQPQKLEIKSSVQDIDSGSGNKKAESDEKTKLLEEPLKASGKQEECCSSCVIL